LDPAQHNGNTLILFAERDAPDISADSIALKNAGAQALKIPGALHSDIFLLEQTFTTIQDQIREWYGGRN